MKHSFIKREQAETFSLYDQPRAENVEFALDLHFVSNNNSHTKETIIPYLFKLLDGLPTSVKILKVWSDGPSSQFKNKFIAVMIQHFEARFDLKIVWNYFATLHGKGCVDGIGATAKKIVRKHVLARDCLVSDATQFVQAFGLTKSNILVEEMTDEDLSRINEELGSNQIYLQARNVRNIKSAHQIQFVNGQLVSYETSKEGYN